MLFMTVIAKSEYLREKTSILKSFKIDFRFFAEMQEKSQILLDIWGISMYILN